MKLITADNTQNGQTLVEVVVAIAILAFAMAAAGTLATTTTRSSTEAGRRTKAAALATREAESVRNLQDTLAQRDDNPDTLYDYLQGNNDVYRSGDCFQFAMRQDEDEETGWTTLRPSPPDAPIQFTEDDFDNPDGFRGYANFNRLVTLCLAQEYNAQSGQYRSSQHMYDMEIDVTWTESDDVQRELIFRNAIKTPSHVDEQ